MSKNDTMIFVNPTAHRISLDALGLDPVEPGAEIEISLDIAMPTRTSGGDRGKSPIEQVAPQLQPKDPADHAAWMAVPPAALDRNADARSLTKRGEFFRKGLE